MRQIEDFGANRRENNKIEIYDFKLNLVRNLKGEDSFQMRVYISNANEIAYILKDIIYIYNIESNEKTEIDYPIKDISLGFSSLIYLNDEYFYMYQYLDSMNLMALAIWRRDPCTKIASI